MSKIQEDNDTLFNNDTIFASDNTNLPVHNYASPFINKFA
jgi:hypothetical protein